MSERSFTIFGCRRDSFLSKSGSLTPFLKEAMTTASLTPGIVFFFFMNLWMNSLRDLSFLCLIWYIPLNSRLSEGPLEVIDELGTEISLGIDRIRWKSC